MLSNITLTSGLNPGEYYKNHCMVRPASRLKPTGKNSCAPRPAPVPPNVSMPIDDFVNITLNINKKLCAMKTRIYLLMVGMLVFTSIAGQQSWDIRTSLGITSGSKVIDGYYFSFDIGIPICKAIQLAPTFTYADMLPNTYFSNSWNYIYPTTPMQGYPTGGPRQEYEYGDNLGSIALLILFLPFDLVNNKSFKKHELIIGAGYSFNSYTMVDTRYEINGENVELLGFAVKSNKSFEPYYGKVSYNYLFNRLFIGITASMISYDNEGELFAGVQLGVKF